MTHNIVAQFSCSLDEHGNFKEYRVVAGSVFNEEYNETLDSATLVLSQVSKEDRLSNIKPYDFVRVFDKSTAYNSETDTYAFDKVYLVDNFDEKENNIKEHIFGYTINLMSETKLLEKIQCPNLTVTHDVVNGKIRKKTIYQVIKQYMELYVPKIKFCNDGQNWSYKRLILLPGLDDTEEFNEATLRVNFNDDNFRPLGHGSNSYVFECLSEQLPSNIDYDSVEVVSVSLDGDVVWSSEVICTFNNTDGTFTMSAITENIYYGSNVITYKYKYLYTENDFYRRFNVPCADLPLNLATLRQTLTTLMQQVGCIPVVKNRVLGFLDFQSDAQDFGDGDYSLNDTVNYIRRSLSSDSFVNSLVNISEQVLDSGNEVICETLGFRDKNNLLLKQQENLTLETSLPIYKVNKCILRFPGKYSGQLCSSVGCIEQPLGLEQHYFYWPLIFYRNVSLQNGTATIKFYASFIRDPSLVYSVHIDNHLIYFLAQRNDGSYYVVSQATFNDFVLDFATTNEDVSHWDSWGSDPMTFQLRSKQFEFPVSDSSIVGFAFSGTVTKNNTSTVHPFSFIKFNANDPTLEFYDGVHREVNDIDDAATAELSFNFAGNRKWDITKLVVENSVRQLLDRDFTKMVGNGIANSPNQYGEMSDSSTWTIDNLSKYVYGTVGYSIGSKTISGFSDVFYIGSKTVLGWVTKNYTYIENIINVLKNYFDDSEQEDLFAYFFGFLNYITNLPYLFLNFAFSYYSPISGGFSSEPFFTTCMFDLYYQPLNSFNLAYAKSKEEIDFPLEQYDGNASGLTDFDRLSIHEQEQVDRFGNETLSISQRTTDYNDIQTFENGPLVFKDDTNRNGDIGSEDNGIDYIIFKRSFSIGNNCFNASYVGSKDAVLKNYFTSIRTKYRAYQYVDYNASVLRKERDTLFVRIATNYFDGDDKIFFGSSSNEKSNLNYLNYLIYDVDGVNDDLENSIPKRISYELEKDRAKISNGLNGYTKEIEIVKNSVSCYSTDKILGLTYEYVDNVGAGTYIADITENADLGGVPQSWQIWDDSYYIRHEVAFINYINFYSQMITNPSDAEVIENQMRIIERSPIVDPSFLVSCEPIFFVCNNNKNHDLKRLFYKDYAERINHTVQFIYYAQNNDVLIGENFISGTPMMQKFEQPFNNVIFGNNNAFYLDEKPHSTIGGETPSPDTSYFEVIIPENSNQPAKLRVHFYGTYKVMKMAHYDSETGLMTDIAAFKRPDTATGSNVVVDYFFAINDTKTDYVMSEKNGILYRRYKVQTYAQPLSGLNPYPRSVVPLYDENEEE